MVEAKKSNMHMEFSVGVRGVSFGEGAAALLLRAEPLSDGVGSALGLQPCLVGWCFRLFGSLTKRNRNARWDKEGFGVKGQPETGPDGEQECLDVQTGNSMPLRCGQHAGSDRELSGAKIH